MEQVLQAIERVWSHFLHRDVTYVVAGGLPLGVVLFVEGVHNVCFVQMYFTSSVLAFLVLSYFMGFTLVHAGIRLRLINAYPGKSFDELEKEYLYNIAKLEKARIPLSHLERIIYVKHMAGAVFVSGVCLAAVIVYYRIVGRIDLSCFWLIMGVASLMVVAYVGYWISNSSAVIQADVISKLAKEADGQ